MRLINIKESPIIVSAPSLLHQGEGEVQKRIIHYFELILWFKALK